MNTNILPEFSSMAAHEFMGKNGFVWWIGVVEDVNDPLKLGRARVRIYGYHHMDVIALPTEYLPWASALAPLDRSTSPKSPPHASWVLGFFLDGQLAQQPVMLGVLNGFRPLDLNPRAAPFIDTAIR